jgi:hypothetical protein
MLATSLGINLHTPAFDVCFLIMMVGGRGKSYVTSIPWVAPLAITGRAFSAVVMKKFETLCASFV